MAALSELPDGLAVSYYTLTGARIGEVPLKSLADRAAAASAAGFTGMALAPEELRRAREASGDLRELVDAVERAALTVPELEPLRGWEESEKATEDERLIYELADAFGSLRVNTIQTAGPETDPELVARCLGAVCDRAAEHGLTIAFEPRANSAIDSPIAAAELVGRVARSNLRICLDAYHFHRAGHGADVLARLDPGLVCSVQLNDMLADPHGPPIEDALDFRLAPGDGVIDLSGWLDQLRRHGITGAVSVEVLSRALRERPVGDAATHVFTRARQVLTQPSAAAGLAAEPSSPGS